MATKIGPLLPKARRSSKKQQPKGKPIAAQVGSVFQIWQAGVLKGKKYALGQGLGLRPFADATFSGEGVVQDGKNHHIWHLPLHGKDGRKEKMAHPNSPKHCSPNS